MRSGSNSRGVYRRNTTESSSPDIASNAGKQSGARNFRVQQHSGTGYYLEKALSPTGDMNHPLDAIRNASIIAHQNGLKFMLLAGFPFIDAAKFAPYVDIYNIQAQGLEKNPTSYRRLVSGISDAVRGANSKFIVITQVTLTQGKVNDMEQSFSLVANNVDGVLVNHVLTSDQLPLLDQFHKWLQQNYR